MKPTMTHTEVAEFMEQLQYVDEVEDRMNVMLMIKIIFALDRLTVAVERNGRFS